MSRPTHASVGQSCVYHLSIRHALSSSGAVLDAEKTNHSKKYSFSKRGRIIYLSGRHALSSPGAVLEVLDAEKTQ